MLPKRFYNEYNISLNWDCKYDLGKFMPALKRQETYLKFNEIEIINSDILIDKESKVLSFLCNSKKLKLIQSN